VMSMPKTVQIVPSTFWFAIQIIERKGGISGETQEQKHFYLGKLKPDFGVSDLYGMKNLSIQK